MRALPAVALIGALGACQPAPAPNSEAPVEPRITAGCDLEVVFGSYAGGTDPGLGAQIGELLANDPGVANVERTPWGREGEYNLCVRATDDAAADRLYRAIAAMIPDSSRRAPTSVTHRDGRRRAADYPQ